MCMHCISHLSEESVKMLQCSTLLHKFCQATMTAITWLTHNCCKVLLGAILFITLPCLLGAILCLPGVSEVCTVSMCSTYNCYLYIKDIPVMICTIGMPFIQLVFVITLIIYSIYVATTGQKRQFLKKMSNAIELIFGTFLKKTNSEGEEEKFIVLGYEVSPIEMSWLFIIMAQASLLAFAQFWGDFLLEVSSSCSADFFQDCFYTTALNTTNFLLPYQELNCSNTSQVEEATSIICYKYVFNTGHAAASAIGIISASGRHHLHYLYSIPQSVGWSKIVQMVHYIGEECCSS